MISLEVEGGEALSRIFARGNDANRKVLARAMTREANRILNESKRIVPFRDGVLKDSGRVEKPVLNLGGIDVEITYGGAAAPYAAVQHWDTTLNHPNGKQALYLLTPVLAGRETFVRSLMETYLRYLRKGTR